MSDYKRRELAAKLAKDLVVATASAGEPAWVHDPDNADIKAFTIDGEVNLIAIVEWFRRALQERGNALGRAMMLE